MATALETLGRVFGPEANGTLMSLREYDQAEFEKGYRYELVHGVLIVSPPPLEQERSPNQHLGRFLCNYQEEHPQGSALDDTLPQHPIRTRRARRVADRVIWAGLGRRPRKRETPTVVVEFVSGGKRDRLRDYKEKREEYFAINVQEYWIIDRFQRTLTVYYRQNQKIRKRVVRENQTYVTALLPGFELSLARLLSYADRWDED